MFIEGLGAQLEAANASIVGELSAQLGTSNAHIAELQTQLDNTNNSMEVRASVCMCVWCVGLRCILVVRMGMCKAEGVV